MTRGYSGHEKLEDKGTTKKNMEKYRLLRKKSSQVL